MLFLAGFLIGVAVASGAAFAFIKYLLPKINLK